MTEAPVKPTVELPKALAWKLLGLLSQELAPCAMTDCRISSHPEADITECREALYAVLRGTPPAAGQEPAWQPIETAPKSPHNALLGWVDGDVRMIRWGKTSHVPIYGWCLADQGVEDFDLCEPSHWMPLPSEPKP